MIRRRVHLTSPHRVHIRDGHETLKVARQVGLARPVVRRHVEQLAEILADHTHQIVRHSNSYGTPLLCVFILRGGALLYPAFARRFTDADVCFLGMRRTNDGVVCEYATPVPRETYDTVLLVDCVIGTGATVRAAHRYVGAFPHSTEYIATLCSSKQASMSLSEEKITVIGFALEEDLHNGLVIPDLGCLDAGDLFSKA